MLDIIVIIKPSPAGIFLKKLDFKNRHHELLNYNKLQVPIKILKVPFMDTISLVKHQLSEEKCK